MDYYIDIPTSALSPCCSLLFTNLQPSAATASSSSSQSISEWTWTKTTKGIGARSKSVEPSVRCVSDAHPIRHKLPPLPVVPISDQYFNMLYTHALSLAPSPKQNRRHENPNRIPRRKKSESVESTLSESSPLKRRPPSTRSTRAANPKGTRGDRPSSNRCSIDAPRDSSSI